jgi:16S rRNA (guanine527-N7)-methyltransferase
LAAAGVGAELASGLARFVVLLGRWQDATNLIGDVSVDSMLTDHVLESLAGARFLPEGGRLLDVGSGNGLPAVPLLLARPGLKGVLLEPRERRWAFLKEAVRELGVDAEVRRERLGEHHESHDAMSVRALAVATWAPLCAKAVRPGGAVVYWASRAPEELPGLAGFEPVITSPLPDPRRGVLAVWRRCST